MVSSSAFDADSPLAGHGSGAWGPSQIVCTSNCTPAIIGSGGSGNGIAVVPLALLAMPSDTIGFTQIWMPRIGSGDMNAVPAKKAPGALAGVWLPALADAALPPCGGAPTHTHHAPRR